MRKKNIIDIAKWIIGLVFLYFMFKSSYNTPRIRRNYMKAQHRLLYNKLVNADCNTLDKELDRVLESSDNPEPRVIKFIEDRMRVEKCN
ncbi:MAG: hypothetical protein ACON47_00655 [Flavobacteriaceae bacterium]